MTSDSDRGGALGHQVCGKDPHVLCPAQGGKEPGMGGGAPLRAGLVLAVRQQTSQVRSLHAACCPLTLTGAAQGGAGPQCEVGGRVQERMEPPWASPPASNPHLSSSTPLQLPALCLRHLPSLGPPAGSPPPRWPQPLSRSSAPLGAGASCQTSHPRFPCVCGQYIRHGVCLCSHSECKTR